MAVREYYAELAQKRRQSTVRRAIGEVRGKLNISQAYTFGDFGSEKRARPRGITSDDAWTLEYITIARIQPLLEAFDNDASGLVSVSEVNAFTSGRPDKWRCVLGIFKVAYYLHSTAFLTGLRIGPQVSGSARMSYDQCADRHQL